jgi:hypothetical protein
MSTSTDAMLFYGYVWTDEESPPWSSDDESGDDEDEEDRYARRAGFGKGLARAKCEIVHHCSDSCIMYGVAVKSTVTTAWRGSPKKIDPAKMAPKPEWADALRSYCEHMGIKTGNRKPAWHLVSWWG